MKKKKRRIRGIFVIWVFMFLTYLSTQIGLGIYNTELSTRVFKNEQIISAKESENRLLSYSITELTSKERVVYIAEQYGLTSNPDNIIITR